MHEEKFRGLMASHRREVERLEAEALQLGRHHAAQVARLRQAATSRESSLQRRHGAEVQSLEERFDQMRAELLARLGDLENALAHTVAEAEAHAGRAKELEATAGEARVRLAVGEATKELAQALEQERADRRAAEEQFEAEFEARVRQAAAGAVAEARATAKSAEALPVTYAEALDKLVSGYLAHDRVLSPRNFADRQLDLDPNDDPIISGSSTAVSSGGGASGGGALEQQLKSLRDEVGRAGAVLEREQGAKISAFLDAQEAELRRLGAGHRSEVVRLESVHSFLLGSAAQREEEDAEEQAEVVEALEQELERVKVACLDLEASIAKHCLPGSGSAAVQSAQGEPQQPQPQQPQQTAASPPTKGHPPAPSSPRLRPQDVEALRARLRETRGERDAKEDALARAKEARARAVRDYTGRIFELCEAKDAEVRAAAASHQERVRRLETANRAELGAYWKLLEEIKYEEPESGAATLVSVPSSWGQGDGPSLNDDLRSDMNSGRNSRDGSASSGVPAGGPWGDVNSGRASPSAFFI